MSTEPQNFDIAIVGQGIAGTLLGFFLEEAGMKVLIIDHHHQGAASMVAAGIVNPITGKKFVKSWRIDDLLPAAKSIYSDIGTKMGIKSYTDANVIFALETIEDENNFLSRSEDELYSKYFSKETDFSQMDGIISKPLQYGEIQHSFHVHLKDILTTFREYWEKKNAYLDEFMNYSDLKINQDGYKYKAYHFNRIVFCEGYLAKDNPFFDKLHMQPAKGEVLLIKIPEAGFKKMYKDKVFFVHQYDDIYWVGSGYEWNFLSEQPTKEAREVLIEEINRVLKIPYEIIDQKAAVRPATANRRPLLRVHSEHPGMYLFNGLGTKGSSLAPFFARQFARYIVKGNPEDLTY